MSVESEFHREFGTCCSRKFESFTVRQHIQRIVMMSAVFVGTLAYLYLVFVVKLFEQFASYDVVNIVQSLITFASVTILAVSACRLVRSVKAVAAELTAKSDTATLDAADEGN